MSQAPASVGDAAQAAPPLLGERVEVEWPCEAENGSGEVRRIWFPAAVVEVQEGRRTRYLLRFEDGGESWSSLRQMAWRRVEEEHHDEAGFVHLFTLEDELLSFCDELHEKREAYGDKSRGDAAYGEPLQGGLVSVVIRRDALPAPQRDLYLRLHQCCIDEVSKAWPGWTSRVGGRHARVRPSQDLRLLQYSEGAKFKAHVDSGWACQALVYLNEDFLGGYTQFPNLGAKYRPRRGRVLLWRSLFVGHRGAAPGSLDDHPASHVAGAVYGGTKRVVSVHLVVT